MQCIKEKNIRTIGTKAYSLIELSIVLVIIGFLIAAVSAGNTLIKQAELRSVISDFQSYAASYNNFIGLYNAVPGDMTNAYLIWGSNCAASAALCDGNGDAVITYNSTTINSDETVKAWNHLYFANMIQTGIAPVSTVAMAIGTNAPASKVSASGYSMMGNYSPFGVTTNAVWIGQATSSAGLTNAALTPKDAWTIDSKMDDGHIDSSGNYIGAITGEVRSVDASNATASGDCAASATGYYNTTITSYQCLTGYAVNSGN